MGKKLGPAHPHHIYLLSSLRADELRALPSETFQWPATLTEEPIPPGEKERLWIWSASLELNTYYEPAQKMTEASVYERQSKWESRKYQSHSPKKRNVACTSWYDLLPFSRQHNAICMISNVNVALFGVAKVLKRASKIEHYFVSFFKKKHDISMIWDHTFYESSTHDLYVCRVKFLEFFIFSVGSVRFRRNFPIPSRFRTFIQSPTSPKILTEP